MSTKEQTSGGATVTANDVAKLTKAVERLTATVKTLARERETHGRSDGKTLAENGLAGTAVNSAGDGRSKCKNSAARKTKRRDQA